MLNKLANKMIMFFLIIILVMAFWEYIHTSEGIALLAPVMGAFPFAEFIVNMIKAVMHYDLEIPLITQTSLLNDIAKLFVSSMLKTFVVSVLLGIFCPVPAYTNYSLSERIDLQEQYTSRLSYKAKTAVVMFVSSIAIVFISNEILKFIYNLISSGGMTGLKTIGYLIVVIGIASGYIYMICSAASISMGRGILFAFCYKLLPKLLDVFITNFICLLLYACIYTNGFGTDTFGILIGLFAWCVIADVIQTGLAGAFGKVA